MKLPVILASLVVASTAYAQAPGDYSGDGDYGDGDIAPPSMAPVVAPVVVAPPPPQRRWSVGLGFGNLELAPHTAPDASTDFDIAQIYVRYRPWRHLEIELALGGGHETDGEYYDGYREVSTAVLALRYRFSPQRRWNWWLMAGMGSLAVTNEYASDAERDDSQSTLQFGAGIERRWSRFALQFELRAVGVAPHETGDMAPKAEPVYPMSTTTQPPGYYGEPDRAHDGWAGGQFVFSGNYYF